MGYDNVTAMVKACRGATMMANTRKPPNAFHFLRQAEVLSKAGQGSAEVQFQARGPLRFFAVDSFDALGLFLVWYFHKGPGIAVRIGKVLRPSPELSASEVRSQLQLQIYKQR